MASAVAGRLTPVLQRKSLQLLPTSSLSKTVQSVQPTEDEPFPRSATCLPPHGQDHVASLRPCLGPAKPRLVTGGDKESLPSHKDMGPVTVDQLRLYKLTPELPTPLGECTVKNSN